MIRSLFPKLFLWYLLGTLLVIGVTLAFDFLGESEAVRDSRRRMWMSNIALPHGQRAADAYLRGSADGLNTMLTHLDQSMGIRGLLFDWNGEELSGRPMAPEEKELAVRAALTDDFQFASIDGHPLVAACVSEPERDRFVFVAQLPTGGSLDFLRRPWPLVERLAIALLVAGSVCYALARYLTGPIRRLRQATQHLAEGDLSVRVAAAARLRNDEIGDLGRDFDFMAERLESLAELQKRLLRDISHELRSPLARLNVALELARQQSGPAAEKMLERIELEAERLNQMIGQLLTLARLEGDAARLETTEVDLAGLIRDLVADANFEAASRNVRVCVTTLDSCGTHGSAALLRSAIENIVRNAVRYTAEGTSVEVSMSCHEPGAQVARVCVRDHGPGVPPEKLSEIFRPFYRVADARERETGGVGLGLSITDRIVRSYGGSVRAENVAGGGLMFEILLPLATGDPGSGQN